MIYSASRRAHITPMTGAHKWADDAFAFFGRLMVLIRHSNKSTPQIAFGPFMGIMLENRLATMRKNTSYMCGPLIGAATKTVAPAGTCRCGYLSAEHPIFWINGKDY